MKQKKNLYYLVTSHWMFSFYFSINGIDWLLFQMGKNYYSQLFLEECKHVVKEKEVTRHITDVTKKCIAYFLKGYVYNTLKYTLNCIYKIFIQIRPFKLNCLIRVWNKSVLKLKQTFNL